MIYNYKRKGQPVAYFANDSEGMCFDETCGKCEFGMEPCPISWVQMNYNHDQVDNETATYILDDLVKQNGECAMLNMMLKKAKTPGKQAKFKKYFDIIQRLCYQSADEKGWHDVKRSDGEIIALIHSELSEGLEWARIGNPKSDHIPSHSGMEEELADVIIRIMDYAETRKFDLSSALLAKMEYNQGREYRHGNKNF